MNIERKEYLIADGIGEVKFIGTNYIVSMMIDDGKMRIGTMEYHKPLCAPSAKIVSDGTTVCIDLDFNLVPVTTENWGEVKRLTDGMMEFYKEFLKQFGRELLDSPTTHKFSRFPNGESGFFLCLKDEFQF